MDAAFSLLKIDREIAERFKNDIANHVYYKYIKITSKNRQLTKAKARRCGKSCVNTFEINPPWRKLG